ncbi:ABC transporter substrate-binding protein [Paenibacillus sp. KS1]|uniref:ABC transporter substrate-binding protein n=1 Tax=Paenibacillus sp. KS1 TaxID=1849249 RepID=UPI0008065534|nr:extracellular solute-binding protein [Paenibacillus sp. KS1]OBY77837.1 ABC transporter substrate-binding protein [Paenibacillus sp. KS1]
MNKRSVLGLLVALAMALTACAGGQNGESKQEGKQGRDGKKTLVLSVFQTDPVYAQAVKLYGEQHPDVDIQIKAYNKGEGSSQEGDLEKYVNTTTTELLSGKGADLIDLNVSGLPIGKYVDKQALVNLSELMKQDPVFDSNSYEMNILDGAKMRGGLYELPLRFSMDSLMGDAKAIQQSGVTFDDSTWTWGEFTKVGKRLAASGGHTYSLGNTTPERMLNILFADNYARVVNEEQRPASFDASAFVGLMEQVKTMYAEKVVTDAEVSAGDYFFAPNLITSPEDYFSGPTMFYEQGKIYRKPLAAGQKAGGTFVASNKLGMNRNSKVQAEAWDFMKFLLSEEIQTMPGLRGFSVNKKVNEKMLKELEDKGTVESPTGSAIQVQKADIDMVMQMLADANTAIMDNSKVQSIIEEEAKAYYNGQKSAQAVAELIANRVTTYLNE